MSLEGKLNLLYGPPASGKTEAAKNLCEMAGWKYLSVGDITRTEISLQTSRGIALQDCLDRVIEYPTDLIAGLIHEKIAEALLQNPGVLLDGYPKYGNEAEAFIAFVGEKGQNVDRVILLDLTFEAAFKRVKDRRICSNCLKQYNLRKLDNDVCPDCNLTLDIREDDTETIFRRRRDDYDRSIRTTLNALKPHINTLYTFNVDKPLDQVLKEISQTIS